MQRHPRCKVHTVLLYMWACVLGCYCTLCVLVLPGALGRSAWVVEVGAWEWTCSPSLTWRSVLDSRTFFPAAAHRGPWDRKPAPTALGLRGLAPPGASRSCPPLPSLLELVPALALLLTAAEESRPLAMSWTLRRKPCCSQRCTSSAWNPSEEPSLSRAPSSLLPCLSLAPSLSLPPSLLRPPVLSVRERVSEPAPLGSKRSWQPKRASLPSPERAASTSCNLRLEDRYEAARREGTGPRGEHRGSWGGGGTRGGWDSGGCWSSGGLSVPFWLSRGVLPLVRNKGLRTR